MEPVVFIMAIMGCADDGMMCQRERVAPVTYESAIACQTAMPDMLRRNTDLSFPLISAACQQRGERQANAEIRASTRS